MLAVVALCLSLLAIVLCVTAPVGAVLGHVALRQTRERDEHGAGMARAAIVVGWIGFAVAVVLVVGFVGYVLTHPSDGRSGGGGWDD